MEDGDQITLAVGEGCALGEANDEIENPVKITLTFDEVMKRVVEKKCLVFRRKVKMEVCDENDVPWVKCLGTRCPYHDENISKLLPQIKEGTVFRRVTTPEQILSVTSRLLRNFLASHTRKY